MDTTKTEQKVEKALDDLEALLSRDENLKAFEFKYPSETALPYLVVSASNPKRVELDAIRSVIREFEVEVVADEPFELSIGKISDKPIAEPSVADSTFYGRGGTQISHSGGAPWGTLTLSLQGMTIEIYQNGQLKQRCHRAGPTLLGVAHLFQPNGTRLENLGREVGSTSCHFNLATTPTVDYAHANWTREINVNNYAIVLDLGNAVGKRIISFKPASMGLSVALQGARSGWQTGTVQSREIRPIPGYGGISRHWRASYTNASGDSGAPIIMRDGNHWSCVGIHFGSGGRFWSWTDLGALRSLEVKIMPELRGNL